MLRYHYHYKYPWFEAIAAEFWWRIEHLPFGHDGQIFGPLTRLGYRQRKAWERRGCARKTVNSESSS
jgi:hypothetical protein